MFGSSFDIVRQSLWRAAKWPRGEGWGVGGGAGQKSNLRPPTSLVKANLDWILLTWSLIAIPCWGAQVDLKHTAHIYLCPFSTCIVLYVYLMYSGPWGRFPSFPNTDLLSDLWSGRSLSSSTCLIRLLRGDQHPYALHLGRYNLEDIIHTPQRESDKQCRALDNVDLWTYTLHHTLVTHKHIQLLDSSLVCT